MQDRSWLTVHHWVVEQAAQLEGAEGLLAEPAVVELRVALQIQPVHWARQERHVRLHSSWPAARSGQLQLAAAGTAVGEVVRRQE